MLDKIKEEWYWWKLKKHELSKLEIFFIWLCIGALAVLFLSILH